MATSPLVDVLNKWGKRAATFEQAGVDSKVIQPLLKYDVQKVMQGGTGMSEQEAQTALVAAASGHSIIGDPKPRKGITGILGAIPSDIVGIVKGFPAGIAHDITHIGDFPKDISKAGAELASGKWAQGIQDVAKTPGVGEGLMIADLIPGVQDVALPATAALYGADVAAKASTPEGRATMKEHPIGTLLEALPGLSEAAGVAGKFAGEAEAGSVGEALQQGRPHAALARAIPAGRQISDVGAIERATLADRVGKLAESVGMDKTTRGIARQRSIAARRMHNQVVDLTTQLGDRVGKWDEAQWQKFYEIGTGVEAAQTGKVFDPTFSDLAPHERAALLEIRKISEEGKQAHYQAGTLMPVIIDGKEYAYPVTSSVARRFSSIQKLGSEMAQTVDAGKLGRLQKTLIQKQKEFIKAVHRDVPAPLQDYVAERTRTKIGEEVQKVGTPEAKPEVEQYIRSNYQSEQLANLTHQIQQSTSWQDFARIVGTRNFYDIYKSTINETLELAKSGFDPIWLRHVPLNRGETILNPKPLQEHYISASTTKSRVLNFGPHYHDASYALIDAGMEQLRADATREFVDKALRPLSTTVGELKTQARAAMQDQFSGEGHRFRSSLQNQLESKFLTYDPSGPFTWKSISVARDSDLAIPRSTAEHIDKMFEVDRKLSVQGTWDKTMKVYKFSVLTGPRHIVHVAVGGMMMMLLRDPLAVTKIPQAIQMVREGKMPVELPQHLYDVPGEHLWDYAGGRTVGRILMSIPNAMKRFEEFSANVERAATHLSGVSRGLDVEAAALEAGKVFVNLDDMTPFERTITKNMVPFYAFTRHLFRYLLTYPVDHPLRAAVLSKFAEQEQADWTSGLPKSFQQLFMIGGGPEQTGVDFKSINPFRSFGNDFSLAGFSSAVNPVAQSALTMMGVNPLTASTDLYPDVSYDSQTGSLVAKRPHTGDWPGVILSEFIPPVNALDHFIQFSDRMRNLKTKNPEAFRRQLFSALNLPFDVSKVNIPFAQEKAEIARYQAAQRAVSQGTGSGDFSEAQRFTNVPFRGQLTSPDQVAETWQQISKALGLPGISTKALVPAYRGTRKRKR